MIYPVKIITPYGGQQFKILHHQYNIAVLAGTVEEFIKQCKKDLEIQTKYLEFFLDDNEMSEKYKMTFIDDSGYQPFREQSDVVSALTYFSKKEK